MKWVTAAHICTFYKCCTARKMSDGRAYSTHNATAPSIENEMSDDARRIISKIWKWVTAREILFETCEIKKMSDDAQRTTVYYCTQNEWRRNAYRIKWVTAQRIQNTMSDGATHVPSILRKWVTARNARVLHRNSKGVSTQRISHYEVAQNEWRRKRTLLFCVRKWVTARACCVYGEMRDAQYSSVSQMSDNSHTGYSISSRLFSRALHASRRKFSTKRLIVVILFNIHEEGPRAGGIECRGWLVWAHTPSFLPGIILPGIIPAQ